MPTFRDIVYGIYGAWRLARLDSGALAYFDKTAEGFWKSFFAAVIVAPGYLLLILFELAKSDTDAGALRLLLVHLCAYTIGWTAFPVAVNHVCDAIGKQERYIGYIVAFNWTKVIQMAVSLPVVALSASEVMPLQLVGLLSGTVSLLILGYEWFVTRTALGIGAMGAIGFVALDLVIDLITNAVTLTMLA